MDNTQLQTQTSNSRVPAIPTAKELAAIRMDRRMFPHYKDIPPQARMKWMAGQIQFLASIARIRDFEAREPVMMASMLDEMIMQDRDMAELTLPELADAFKNGVFGLYGEFFGLSAPNLFGFINSFLDSDKKKEATEMVRNAKDEFYQKKKEELAEMQERIRAEIEEAMRRGEFIPTGKVWFQPKTVNELIDAEAHREKVRQQAREILKANEQTD